MIRYRYYEKKSEIMNCQMIFKIITNIITIRYDKNRAQVRIIDKTFKCYT